MSKKALIIIISLIIFFVVFVIFILEISGNHLLRSYKPISISDDQRSTLVALQRVDFENYSIDQKYFTNALLTKYSVKDEVREGETVSVATLDFAIKTPTSQVKKIRFRTARSFFDEQDNLMVPEEMSNYLKEGAFYNVLIGVPTANFSQNEKEVHCKNSEVLLKKISVQSCVVRIPNYDLDIDNKIDDFWVNNQNEIDLGEVMLRELTDQSAIDLQGDREL